ncbi:MAG: LysE family translocator [Rhodospirillaceae bacterium]|nr:LysE family translocator [Rhodospirillaceae bacterium]MBT6140011.1 LysE family translocator [Rhodospirillaceae bacterium]
MVETLVLFVLAALPLMGSPGPATLSIAATSSVFGVVRTLPYMAGVVLGTSTVVLLIATGVTGLLFAIPGVLPILTGVALVYILYLAYKIGTAPILTEEAGTRPAPSLLGGWLLAVANPKAFAAIGAVFASFVILPDRPVLDATVKSAAMFVIVVGVNGLWLILGAALSRVLRHPRTGRYINIGFAVLLVLSVAMVALI